MAVLGVYMNKIIVAVLTVIIAVVLASVLYVGYYSREIHVRVATTTSLYATGLLDYLAEAFEEKRSGVVFDFIPVGSGEALRRAANGDACMVFVHAPSLEKKYIEQGVLDEGHIFAYNYFVIVGPSSDPANVSRASSVIEAFKRIYRVGEEGKALFISRGDNSGTHVRELSIWARAGLNPRGRSWYLETGSGMGETLLVANEKKAYTLSDIGTYLKYKKDGRIPYLTILYTNDSELINIYSVYIVKSCSGSERKMAEEFMKFVIGEVGQKLISEYKVKEYGVRLFNPVNGRLELLRSLWVKLSEG